jgi:hypothetical protein
MDQLQADLRTREVTELPAAWQFVHIDVNPVPESTPGLGDIRKLGGSYVAVSSAGNTFSAVRQNVEARLHTTGRLDGLLGWAPEPRELSNVVPVGTGAGQFRAVGRMLTLTRLDQIQNALQLSWQTLQQALPWGELPMKVPEEGPYDNAASVIPIVVGSLAGGSGASMFLDVCRVLGRISGLDRRLLGVFLYSPDVFSSLDPAKRKGIDGNALAALGELMAAQVGQGDESDNELLVGLGLAPEPAHERAFGGVFPIGSFIGGDGARFGETAEDIYRGLGRALAATMFSDVAARQYLQTRFENPLPPTDGQALMGWGAGSTELPWGSFGYSSLSLGRDRYAHYAAQRLARTAVDRLVEGFKNPASALPPTDQLEQQVANQLPVVLQNLRLPAAGASSQQWLRSGPLRTTEQLSVAAAIVAPVMQSVAGVTAPNARKWLELVQQTVSPHQPIALQAVEERAYAWAETYAEELEKATVTEVMRIVAHPKMGLPYARKVLERLIQDVPLLVENLKQAPTNVQVLDIDPATAGLIAQAELGPECTERVRQGFVESVRRAYEIGAARKAAAVLTSYAEDVLDALRRSVNNALDNLDAAIRSTAAEAGLAQLNTTIYNEWPENSDQVPPRFAHAQNEVLLTTADVFPGKFVEHVTAVADDRVFATGLDTMVQAIVRGAWDNVGAEPSTFEVVKTEVSWRAPELRRDAKSGEPRPQSKPVYTLKLATGDILERALAFQARKDQDFARFSGETFEGYLDEYGIVDAERERRRAELVQKFEQAVRQAHPLVGVSRPMIEALHHSQLTVELSFSTVPLAPGSSAATAVSELFARIPGIDTQSVSRFENALKASDGSRRIAIYGSYPKYLPLVFSSFLTQLQERWSGESEEGRLELWKWKRTRGLPASIGISRRELQALIKGWYLGRALGLIHQPASTGSHDPVQVFDLKSQSWLKFEPRLLTARAQYRDADGFDWLPGILEGHTLAVVNCVNDTSFAALRPYQALRAIFDDGVQPSVGNVQSGGDLVQDWLISGKWPSGETSPIDVIARNSGDLAARAESLSQWISNVREFVASKFLTEPTGPGHLAARHVRIDGVDQVGTAPMFAEIALTTYDSLGELLETVRTRVSRTRSEEGADAAPQI